MRIFEKALALMSAACILAALAAAASRPAAVPDVSEDIEKGLFILEVDHDPRGAADVFRDALQPVLNGSAAVMVIGVCVFRK